MLRLGLLYGAAITLLGALFLFATAGTTESIVAIGAAGLLACTVLLGPTRFGTLLVFLGVFTAPMNSLRPGGGSVTFSDLFLLLGFLLLVPRMLRQRVRPSSLHLLGSLLLFAAGCIASLHNPDTASSLGYLVKMMTALTLLPLAFLLWHPSLRQLVWMAWAYVAGQLVSLADGFAGSRYDGRFYGLTTHPNFFGMCSLLAAALCLFLLARSSPQRRPWPIAACGLCLLGVLFSGSRAALLAAVVVAVVFPILERSAKAGYLVVLAATVTGASLGVLLANAGPGTALGRLAGKGTASGSDDQRIDSLQQGWETFTQGPLLGTGFSFETSLTHNGYLEVATAFGIFGFLGYAAILWALVRVIFRARRRNLLGYVALGYCFISFFNNTLWDRFAWVALSMVLIGEQLLREQDSPESSVVDDVPPRPVAAAGRA